MDPFKQLLRDLSPPSTTPQLHMVVGKVKEPYPLVVDIAGTDQEQPRFFAPPELVPHPGPPWAMDPGDKLLLLTENWQEFWIVGKVVQL